MRDRYDTIDVLPGDESGSALIDEAWALRLVRGNDTTIHVLSDNDLDLLTEAVARAAVARRKRDEGGNPKVGDRVRLIHDRDVLGDLVPEGAVGTVADVNADAVWVHMDDDFPFLAAWENDVMYEVGEQPGWAYWFAPA